MIMLTVILNQCPEDQLLVLYILLTKLKITTPLQVKPIVTDLFRHPGLLISYCIIRSNEVPIIYMSHTVCHYYFQLKGSKTVIEIIINIMSASR